MMTIHLLRTRSRPTASGDVSHPRRTSTLGLSYLLGYLFCCGYRTMFHFAIDFAAALHMHSARGGHVPQ